MKNDIKALMVNMKMLTSFDEKNKKKLYFNRWQHFLYEKVKWVNLNSSDICRHSKTLNCFFSLSWDGRTFCNSHSNKYDSNTSINICTHFINETFIDNEYKYKQYLYLYNRRNLLIINIKCNNLQRTLCTGDRN